MMNDSGAVGFMFQLDAGTYDQLADESRCGGFHANVRLDKPFLSHDVVEFTVAEGDHRRRGREGTAEP